MAARRRPDKPPRYNALVASAMVMTQRPEGMSKLGRTEAWQEEAWRFYDEVGELRFGIGWLANGMSRVNLVAGRQPQSLGDEPQVIVSPDPDAPPNPAAPVEPLTDIEQAAVDLISAVAGGADGQGQMLSTMATHLSVPGVGWVLLEAEAAPLTESPILITEPVGPPVPDETWTWKVYAYEEVRAQGEYYEVRCGPNDWRAVAADHVLIKVWRPHARRSWEPDSPCRAVLNVLRQIAMLDEHVTATAQSRLAGAGLLIVPNEVEFAPLIAVADPTTPADGTEDGFTQVLVTTMTVPIGDRGSAAAVVPLVVKVPGEHADKFRHLTFWSEFSQDVLPLRDSGVKRLALGLDMPPEILLGVGGMNHWGAWQVEETAITLHIEPMSELICHALTIGYLRPALNAMGFDAAEVDNMLVWYDATDLTTRPDRSEDTMALYDRIEVSGATARREAGLSEDDAPTEEEKRLRILLDVAKGAPTLAPQMLAEAGLLDPQVAQAAAATVAQGGSAPTPPPAPPPEQGPPPEEPPAPAEIAASAMVEACDGLVHRALERAGSRLRSAAGKRTIGGAGAVECEDVSLMHVTLPGGATTYLTLDAMLAGAWTRVPKVAERIGCDSDSLTAALDGYTRALLATGHEHDSDRLAAALGLHATV